MEKTMIILNIMAILGFPTVFVMLSALFKKVGKYSGQIKILMSAQQAQMRSQLLKDYYTYKQSAACDFQRVDKARNELHISVILKEYKFYFIYY